MKHNLLTEPIFSLDLGGAPGRATLPAVLARLARREAFSFAALQAHQIQSWESFLIQLGALVARAEGGDFPADEAGWREALRALGGGDDAAWCLVVDDLSKPAFMQPPVVGDDFRTPKDSEAAADRFDMLVTSKNHDVKAARAYNAAPEYWVFALTNLQTSDGYPGRGNYGIARMNGGLGSRASVGFTTGLHLGARFARDAKLWQTQAETQAETHGFSPSGGHALLWCVAWDGASSLPLDALDLGVIEVCRRIRLGLDGDAIVGWRSPTECARVNAKDVKGVLGDVWVPIKRGDERAVFTSGEAGFSYKVLSELLLGKKYDHAEAMKPQPDDPAELLLLARVMVRGQGTTAGLHERVLPVPNVALRRIFGTLSEREAVARYAQERVDDVTTAQNKVLHVALCVLLQDPAEGQKLDLTDKRTQRWKTAFDTRVDQIFFASLFADLDLALAQPNEAAVRWQKTLVDLAREVFDEAAESAPSPSVRRFRAQAKAEKTFRGCAHKNFPDAMNPSRSEPQAEVTP